MAEPDPFNDESTTKSSRNWTGRLKGRLFSRDRAGSNAGEDSESVDNAVADFLGPDDPQSSQKRKLVPRLDVNTTKPNLFGDDTTAAPVLEPFRYMKPPRRSGLKVGFVVTVPEIIGEGGEDSEIATIEISKAKPRPLLQPTPHSFNSRERRRPSASGLESSLAGSPIPRKPVKSDPDLSQSDPAPASASAVSSAAPYPEDHLNTAPQLRKLSNLDTASAQDLRRMREDEGDALRLAVRQRASSDFDGIEERRSDELAQRTILPPQRSSEEAERLEEDRVAQDTGFSSLSSLIPPPLYISPSASPPQSAGRDSINKSTQNNTPSPDFTASRGAEPSTAPRKSFATHMRQASYQSASSSTESFSVYDYKYPDRSSLHVTPTSAVSLGASPGSGMSAMNMHSTDATKEISTSKKLPQKLDDDASAKVDAFEEFSRRVSHWKRLFELSASAERPSSAVSIMEWLRAALWWFLKGRAGLEEYVRITRGNDGDQGSTSVQPQLPRALVQDYVNLAKAWWIISDVVLDMLESNSESATRANATNNEQSLAVGVLDDLNGSFKNLALSMARRNLLPPTELLIHGLDTSPWIIYPSFPTETMRLLSGTTYSSLDEVARSHDPQSLMPLGDMTTIFCLGRVFVLCKIFDEGDKEDVQNYPCVLSMLRSTTGMEPRISVASQSPLVNVHVFSNNKFGPSWEHIRWEHDQNSLRIKLPQKLRMRLYFRPIDFESVRNFVEKTRRSAKALDTVHDEETLYEFNLTSIRYDSHTRQTKNPLTESFRSSKGRLFQTFQGGKAPFKLKGYRLAVMTDPKSRNIRSMSIDLSLQTPLEYDYLRDNAGKPALRLRINEEDKFREIYLSFYEPARRDDFVNHLTGIEPGPGEVCTARIPLKTISIQVESDGTADTFTDTAAVALPLTSVHTVQRSSTTPGTPQEPQNLLTVASGKEGVVANRMNRGFGETFVRLGCQGDATLHVRTAPRSDFSAALRTDATKHDLWPSIRKLSDWKHSLVTIDSYWFNSMPDLHAFQLAVMGCHVLFDAVVQSFDISKKRMVTKHHEASNVRIQVVSKGSIFHLLAFFQKFSLADALRIQLKSTDVFEQHDSKSSGCGVRLVDAKFSLPADRREKTDFVCIDSHEPPMEHEDIIVGFEGEADRERFVEALPAATTGPRKFTLKRRI